MTLRMNVTGRRRGMVSGRVGERGGMASGRVQGRSANGSDRVGSDTRSGRLTRPGGCRPGGSSGRPGEPELLSHANGRAIVAAGARSGSTSNQTRFVSTSGGSSLRPGVSLTASASDLGVPVIVGQAGRCCSQSVKRGGGQDSRLPPRTAEQLPYPASLGDEVLRPSHRRPNRCPKSLAEADGHAVKRFAPVGQGDAGGHMGVPQPGAVQVHD